MQVTHRAKGFIFHFLNIYLKDFSILDDANNLLIHHVKRQTSIHKEDKHKIKVLLKHFLMDRFKHPRQEMSEDEREEEDESGKEDAEADSESGKGNSRRKKSAVKDDVSSAKQDDVNNKSEEVKTEEPEIKVEAKDGRRTPLHARDMEPVAFNQFF
jgi:paired amphipathic helix protein Sin3a